MRDLRCAWAIHVCDKETRRALVAALDHEELGLANPYRLTVAGVGVQSGGMVRLKVENLDGIGLLVLLERVRRHLGGVSCVLLSSRFDASHVSQEDVIADHE